MEAYLQVDTILQSLRNQYPGLDGRIRMDRLASSDPMLMNTPFMELVLCNGPFIHPAGILENIVNLSKRYRNWFKVIIAFKEVKHGQDFAYQDEIALLAKKRVLIGEDAENLLKKYSNTRYFSIRIFYQLRNHYDRLEEFERMLMGGIRNYWGELPYCKKTGKINRMNIHSPSMLDGTSISPADTDFHMYHDFPIPSAIEAPRDNFSSPMTNFMNKMNRIVKIGRYIDRGMVTIIDCEFPVDTLRQFMTVFGLTRTGKTTFISQLLRSIKSFYPDIGQLIICMKDDLELKNFEADVITGYGDPEFGVSWINASTDEPSDPERIAAYIAGALGLLDNGKRYILNRMSELKQQGRGVPRRFEEFLKGVLQYLGRPENKYGRSHDDIMQATKQRIDAFLGSKRFLDAVAGRDALLTWLFDWFYKGRRVLLDLRRFSIHEKRFIVLAILHLIHSYTKPSGDQLLKRLFVCDEAHILFHTPKTSDHYDSENLGQYQLDSYVERTINELANTGTGGIFADQNPYAVLDSIRNQVGTRIFFRISQESAKLLSNDPQHHRFFSIIPDHMCWVESGPTGNQYFMKPYPPSLDLKAEYGFNYKKAVEKHRK